MSTVSTKTTALPNPPYENVPYSFGTKSYEDAKAKLIDQSSQLNPDEEIKNFKKIVSDRGYGFFSDESMKAWKKKYDMVSQQNIMQWAQLETEQYLKSVKDPGNPEHQKNRLLFHSQFGNSENEVLNYFIKKNEENFGRDNHVIRNQSYENNIINSLGPIESKHQAWEHATFSNLMKNKWDALGYYKDEDYVNRFLSEYCIALKKK